MLRKRSIWQVFLVVIAAVTAYLAVTLFPRIWSPEHRLSDWMVTFVSPSRPVDPDIVLVTVRDGAEYRQRLSSLLPTDRRHLADVVSCISQAEPRVIGFDMLFDWPDADGASVFQQALTEAAQEIPIVIGVPLDTGNSQTASESVREIGRFAAQTQTSLGVIDLIQTGDHGTVRTALGDRTTAPLKAFSSIVAQQSGIPIQNSSALDRKSFRIAWSHPKLVLVDTPVHFTNYETLGVLDTCSEGGVESLKTLFAGKIVLIGSQAQRDQHRIPLSTLAMYEDGLSGIEIHATIIAQTLRGPNIIVPNRWFDGVLALIVAFVGLLMNNHAKLKEWKKFALVGAGVCVTIVTWGLFAAFHLLLPLSLILIALTNGAFVEQAATGTIQLRDTITEWIKRVLRRHA